MDIELLESWMLQVAVRLGAALEESRVHGERLDALLTLLLSLGASTERIAGLLPENVAESRRKLLGPGRIPGFVASSGDRASRRRTAQESALRPSEADREEGSLLDAARARARGPQQSLVLSRVIAAARSGSASRWTAGALAEELAAEGRSVHVETVRRCLDQLVDVGLLLQPAPGRYELSPNGRHELPEPSATR